MATSSGTITSLKSSATKIRQAERLQPQRITYRRKCRKCSKYHSVTFPASLPLSEQQRRRTDFLERLERGTLPHCEYQRQSDEGSSTMHDTNSQMSTEDEEEAEEGKSEDINKIETPSWRTWDQS